MSGTPHESVIDDDLTSPDISADGASTNTASASTPLLRQGTWQKTRKKSINKRTNRRRLRLLRVNYEDPTTSDREISCVESIRDNEWAEMMGELVISNYLATSAEKGLKISPGQAEASCSGLEAFASTYPDLSDRCHSCIENLRIMENKWVMDPSPPESGKSSIWDGLRPDDFQVSIRAFCSDTYADNLALRSFLYRLEHRDEPTAETTQYMMSDITKSVSTMATSSFLSADPKVATISLPETPTLCQCTADDPCTSQMHWSARSVFKTHLRSFTHTPHPSGTSKKIIEWLETLTCPRLRLLAELAISDELTHDHLRLSTHDSKFLLEEVGRLAKNYPNLAEVCEARAERISSCTSGGVPAPPCPDPSTIGQPPTGVGLLWSLRTTVRSAANSEFRRNFATRTMLHMLKHLQHAASEKDQKQMMGDFVL